MQAAGGPGAGGRPRVVWLVCIATFATSVLPVDAQRSQKRETGGGLDMPAPRDGALTVGQRTLQLCLSSDAIARRYCLNELREMRGAPPRGARTILADMAANDPRLQDEARATYRAIYGKPVSEERTLQRLPPQPPPGARQRPALSGRTGRTSEEQPEAPPEREPEDEGARGDPTRVIQAPTAYRRPEGTSSFNVYQLSTFDFDWGITDHLEIGVQTTVPAGLLFAGVSARYGTDFTGGAVALQANVIGLLLLTDGSGVLLFGGGPVVTLGNRDHFVTFGLGAYGAKVGGELGGVMAASTGGSLSLGDHVRLNAELWAPMVIDPGKRWYRDLVVVLGGIRVFGGRFWGDIALIAPICPDCSDVYDVTPIGIPLLGFGLQF